MIFDIIKYLIEHKINVSDVYYRSYMKTEIK